MNKKCPYCDSEKIGIYKGISGVKMAYCIDCADTHDHAVTVPLSIWNNRPEEERLKKLVAKLQEEIRRLIPLDEDEEEYDFFVIDENNDNDE